MGKSVIPEDRKKRIIVIIILIIIAVLIFLIFIYNITSKKQSDSINGSSSAAEKSAGSSKQSGSAAIQSANSQGDSTLTDEEQEQLNYAAEWLVIQQRGGGITLAEWVAIQQRQGGSITPVEWLALQQGGGVTPAEWLTLQQQGGGVTPAEWLTLQQQGGGVTPAEWLILQQQGGGVTPAEWLAIQQQGGGITPAEWLILQQQGGGITPAEWLAIQQQGGNAALAEWLALRQQGQSISAAEWIAIQQQGGSAALTEWLAIRQQGQNVSAAEWIALQQQQGRAVSAAEWIALQQQGGGVTLGEWLALQQQNARRTVPIPPMPTPPPVRKTISGNMILVNSGNFEMDIIINEQDPDDYIELRQVTVNSFYISKYEVTQREYENVMKNNPSYFKGPNLPVENVSWFDAIEYCNALSRREGLTLAYTITGSGNDRIVTWNKNANGYRLPTEEEWVYACRANTTTPYNTGDTINRNLSNYFGRRTVNVGSYAPNNWGLYDMHGNVSEWCWNLFSSESVTRIIRGGSWLNTSMRLRSSFRDHYYPQLHTMSIGFRVVQNFLDP